MGRWLLAAVLLATTGLAAAHKSSDAYLQLRGDGAGAMATLRVDVALRDLDVALDLDADGNGSLTWGEIRAAQPAIEAYLRARVQVAGCPLGKAVQSLEKRVDGVYAALQFAADCRLTSVPAIRYTVMAEIDPTHRGIARITVDGAAPVLRVLDPTHPDIVLATPSTAPSSGTAAPSSGSTSGAAGASAGSTSSATVPTPASVVDGSDGGLASGAVSAQPSPGSGLVSGPVSGPTRAGSSASTLASTAASPSSSAEPATVQGQVDAARPPIGQFLREGVHHILSGYDHILFLLCLLLPSVLRRTPTGWQPVARLRDAVLPVATIVTAFTLAHSITLGLAASKLVSLSPAFIEPSIAVTIALAALDNLFPVFHGRRALVTFAFGLIHGFGFAGVLAELDLPTAAFAWALLQFNLGIEVGQLTIVAVAVTVLYRLRADRRYVPWVLRGGSCVAIVVATAWFIERTANVVLLPF